jgi:CheY-like chemotaxis protein
MVVDDNADAADVMALLLEMHGYQMSVEYTGEGALRKTGAAPPDAMLIDIGLPDMEGYTLARLLGASSATAQTTLIACTGYGQPKDLEKSRRAGFDHHLVKPVDIAQLLALLDALRNELKPAVAAS